LAHDLEAAFFYSAATTSCHYSISGKTLTMPLSDDQSYF
jgi:hypothetical protein